MSEFKDFADFVEPKLDSIDSNVANAVTSLAAVGGDVQFLKDEIAKLQPISLEDKQRLDAIKSRVAALDGNVANLSSSVKALDDSTTPPAV